MVKARLFLCVRSVCTAALLMTTSLAAPALAETDPLDAPMQEITLGPDDTIRGIVGQYLRDPDLWPAILALNNIASPAALQPGTVLRLPVQQVFAADAAL